MGNVDLSRLNRAKIYDRIARWLITACSTGVIACVLAILVLILTVALPLFLPASSEQRVASALPPELRAKSILAVGVETDSGSQGPNSPWAAHIIDAEGFLWFLSLSPGEDGANVSSSIDLRTGKEPSAKPKDAAAALRLVAIERQSGARYSLLWGDGSASAVEVSVKPQVESEGRRKLVQRARIIGKTAADPLTADAVQAVVRCPSDSDGNSNEVICARRTANHRIVVDRDKTVVNEIMDTRETQRKRVVLDNLPGPIATMTMSEDGRTLYAGTTDGALAYWRFREDGDIASRETTPAFRDRRGITSLGLLLGDVSLAVGDSRGELSTWAEVAQGNSRKLRRIHHLGHHLCAVREIQSSGRNKALATLGGDGAIHVDYATNERRLLELTANGGIQAMGYSTRGDAILGLGSQGHLIAWTVEAPHPEVSWRALFGRVHYEGYSEPACVWQTTGGNDFEPKICITPLLFGTLKGTFYAMLFAVPLALFGAMYVSHFTTPRLKQTIKPIVEVMAAVPSVVLGFLAALWLAPILERWFLAFAMSFFMTPLVFAAFMLLWQQLRTRRWAKRIETGYEFAIVIPVLFVGVVLAATLAKPMESLFFDGNFRQWLFEHFDVRYDQRNCVIIAFGLGFAVIPIIFSMAEDSLSSVPRNLTAASLALGASRWQTLWRVVLPSASPGIFAGIMIGFGRAVGETMIVLMATGNTPIMDWSFFNGMRTLSANIAVEMPEAPVGGTLYRVLFLCAVILFVLTFFLNTAAEFVRTRLRNRYGRFV